jgi:Methyltransferase domain
MNKLLMAAALMAAPVSANAMCHPAFVNGRTTQLCDNAMDLPGIPPIGIAPLVSPSIPPIQAPMIPPIGTSHCNTRDMVFVDASHAYEYVKGDTERALSLLKPDGLLIWHDYGEWPGVTQALNGLYRGDARFAGMRQVAETTLCFVTKGDEP